MFARLVLPSAIRDAMIEHARAETPNECCGLLAGTVVEGDGVVQQRFPIRNDLASPTEYFTNARDLLDAMRSMRESGLEPLAFYHSHPSSEPIPSRTDIERNHWGETVMHVIIGLATEPMLRAWWIGESSFREAEMAITSS